MSIEDKNVASEIKVSVYCAAFNHEKYIRDTLEGFVNQITNFRFEVFVHEDASTDNTKEIIQEYAEKYPNIIFPIYQKENQYSKGVRIFAKYVLPCANGRYIAICEGDDYWCDKYKLQKQVDFLDNHLEYSACSHNSVIYDMFRDKNRFYNESLKAYDVQTDGIIKKGGLEYHTSSVMYRIEWAREAYSDNRPDFFNKPKNIGDYPLSIFLSLKGKIKYLPDIMSVYRLGTPGSWSWSMSSMKLRSETEQSLINMLMSVDDYTSYMWHDTIQDVINQKRFNLLNTDVSIEILNDIENKKIFKKQSFIIKCKLWVKLLFLNQYRYRKKEKKRRNNGDK